MVGTWEALGPRYTAYRDELVRYVRNLSVNTVIYRLDNCSVTIVDRDHDGGLILVQSGREADTLIR